MDAKNLSLAAGFVKEPYIRQGAQALNSRRNLITALLANRKLPAQGWDDLQIEHLLPELALMDSNNFLGNVGVGEREARVYSSLVAKRSFNFCHGIGRSGDIAEVQPKAAGSSLLCKLCNALVLDALAIAGLVNVKACLVLPLATGMSVALTLTALRAQRPAAARYVIWPRMDQKSCLKAIVTAGCIPVVVPNQLQGDQVCMDMEAFKAALAAHAADSILCVLTTVSCFAPRVPDPVDEVAKLCAAAGIPHVVNNAYGLQCKATMKKLNRAMTVGRVDAVIQSTDKNFMVPVGGAVVCSPSAAVVAAVGKAYPGRASMAPVLDLFITLLSMGASGYKQLLQQRETLAVRFQTALAACAAAHSERLLASPSNSISFAMSLNSIADPSRLGSMLFTRCVSGTRVVDARDTDSHSNSKEVAGTTFSGYGASVDAYPCAYMTAACAIGMQEHEIDEFISRLSKLLSDKKLKVSPHIDEHSSTADKTSDKPDNPETDQQTATDADQG